MNTFLLNNCEKQFRYSALIFIAEDCKQQEIDKALGVISHTEYTQNLVKFKGQSFLDLWRQKYKGTVRFPNFTGPLSDLTPESYVNMTIEFDSKEDADSFMTAWTMPDHIWLERQSQINESRKRELTAIYQKRRDEKKAKLIAESREYWASK